MTSFLSDRVNSIKPSPTIAVSNKAAELKRAGKDVIGLGAGEPDFDTPQHISDAAHRAIDAGMTRYTAVDGIPELKQAIIEKFQRDNQLSYASEQVIVNVGGKQSFYNLVMATLNPEDEVIIPAPYWVSYPDMVVLAEGTPVVIEAPVSQRFKITPEQLEAAITEKTKLFVINSPSNPSGMAYTKSELEALADVLRKHPNILIATDDMYEHILWTEESFCNILMAAPDLYNRTLVLNGVSKAYAMTGWRIGYAAGPADIIKGMKKIQSQSTSNPTSVSQWAALEALNGPQDCIPTMLEAFKERHDAMIERLNAMPYVEAAPGDGTFYIFFNIEEAMKKAHIDSDVAFASDLLEKVGVAVVPGSAFGLEGYQRMSFATSMEQLQDAMNRLEKYLQAL